MKDFGTLDEVPLREGWPSESADFTPWLARPENIKRLSAAIGLDLEVESCEKDVGPFSADILCKDMDDGAWVLIENQLERTNHGHLGQLITYAAGLEAVVIVWIAERFTEEHRAALDWLNELASEKLRCFGLEIQLWKIGESAPAPKFNVVSAPNDWARDLSKRASQMAAGPLPERRVLQLDYWTAFAARAKEIGVRLPLRRPRAQHWLSSRLGRSGFRLSAVATSLGEDDGDAGQLRAEMVIDHSSGKDLFAELERERAKIDLELGEPPVWHDAPNARRCKIYFRRDADWTDRTEWGAQHAWLLNRLERLQRVFEPRVRTLGVLDGSGGNTTDEEERPLAH